MIADDIKPKVIVYYQDLSSQAQEDLRRTVRTEFIKDGARREPEETDEEFERRMQQDIDDYINVHNFANEFYLW